MNESITIKFKIGDIVKFPFNEGECIILSYDDTVSMWTIGETNPMKLYRLLLINLTNDVTIYVDLTSYSDGSSIFRYTYSNKFNELKNLPNYIIDQLIDIKE